MTIKNELIIKNIKPGAAEDNRVVTAYLWLTDGKITVEGDSGVWEDMTKTKQDLPGYIGRKVRLRISLLQPHDNRGVKKLVKGKKTIWQGSARKPTPYIEGKIIETLHREPIDPKGVKHDVTDILVDCGIFVLIHNVDESFKKGDWIRANGMLMFDLIELL